MTDAQLLCEARSGNAEAWRTLYKRCLPAVWRQAYALVSDSHIAEDVTSETMLALLQNIHRIDTETPRIAGWLRSVVRCKVADHHRRAFRARDHLQAAAEIFGEEFSAADPARPLENDETKSQVLRVLDRLSDRQRCLLEWKYLEGLRVRDIAERLGETEKAIETVLYRARREFRRLFESEEFCRADVRTARPPSAELSQES